jgi:hypothetical protein
MMGGLKSSSDRGNRRRWFRLLPIDKRDGSSGVKIN